MVRGNQVARFGERIQWALLALAALAFLPATSYAGTISAVTTITVPSTVNASTVLGPQTIQVNAANAYTTSTRLGIEIDIANASFVPSGNVTISGVTCASVAPLTTKLIFDGCMVPTQGTVTYQVSGVSYTNAAGLTSGTSITLSGLIYNSNNSTQIFENITSATVVQAPAVNYTLTTTTFGTGTGTVTASPSASSYASGTVVTLTATPDTGSTFSGWSGGGCGTATTCQVTMTENKTVTATFNRPLSTVSLITQTNGTGSGTVSPPSLTVQSGSVVTLTATPATGSVFAGWSGGGCSGTATTCQVTLNTTTTVTATFNANTFTLTTSTTGTGTGAVSASPSASSYAAGAVVTLTAVPGTGSIFGGWSGGGCSGTSTTCSVTMSSNQTVTATFTRSNAYTLTLSYSGTGTGVIVASPAAASYNPGTVVTLTATTFTGSTFAGWSGGGCSGTATTCSVTMNSNQTVTAAFNGPGATSGILRQAAVFSSVSPTSLSFLRFFNASTVAGTVTVTLSDYLSGQSLGQWTSPSIAPGAAPQYSISTVEAGLTSGSTKPTFYSVTMTSQFIGTFQHVLFKPSDGTLTNLSTCDSGITAVATRVANVHSSLLGNAGYPSSIVIYNTGTSTASASLTVSDAGTGRSLGVYTTSSIPANGEQILPVTTLESTLGVTPSSSVPHYVVTMAGTFTGYLQHLVNNSAVGVTTDMSTVCTFPTGGTTTPTQPSNPSGS